jgi:RNA polymerase sigma-70 factor (ECF subfamily)
MTSDEQLIKKASGGDSQAFDELVLRYNKRVINTAFGMLSDYHDACDAAQEVFLRVYKNLSSFKGGSAFSTWLYRITVNVCNDLLRKRKKHASVSLTDEDSSVCDIPDTAQTPHERAEKTELRDIVRAEVARLSDEYRTVITLYEFEGASYEQIADILNCPIGTVKSRINRAKKQLRKNLEGKRELFL